MQHLFLASTSFNIITAAMVAKELNDGDEAYLWLIDQPHEINNFTQQVLNWTHSPFQKIEIVSYKAKKLADKIKRKKTLIDLVALLSEIRPEHIYTGNDRRVEFQYLMHLANKGAKKVTGHYIDDGTYSYVGKKDSWIGEATLNNIIKKLTYGIWWHQPQTIGGSTWIDCCHLAFPEFALKKLQEKKLYTLPQNITSNEFLALSESSTSTKSNISEIDKIAILPHSSVSNELITRNIMAEVLKGRVPALKNHPRNSPSPKINNLITLEASVPMEIFLPQLPSNCCLIGDISTALLTAKWLRPELQVIAYYNNDSPLLDLMKKLGITTRQISEGKN